MEIAVLSKRHGRKVILIDDVDAEAVTAHAWSIHRHRQTFYATTMVDGNKVRLHRFLMPSAKMVDHRNGNGLDNQRKNLRACTPGQNMQNQRIQRRQKSSRYKGVSWHKQRGKWAAYIRDQGKRKSLGLYRTEEEAARAYNAEAVQRFGEFARLNEV